MSLKTDYLEGPDGLTEQMNDVFVNGVSFVTSNLAAISTALKNSAATGKTEFTVTIAAGFEPENLRLKGRHAATYFAGIQKGLADEDIYDYECTPTLNEGDQTSLQVDLNFTWSSQPTV